MNIKEQARKLKEEIPVVYLSLNDKRTPTVARIVASLTVAYALSPIDLIPDFVPVLGYLDDLVVLPFLILLTLKLIPDEVLNENKDKAKQLILNKKPERWYYSLIMILIWMLIIIVILNFVVKK